MPEKTFSVPNISCGHCVAAIQEELSGLDGVQKVEGNSAAKEVVVEWADPASEADIREKLKEINYPAAS